MSARLFSFVILAGMGGLVLELIRRGQLTFRYAFGWLAAVLGGVVIVAADQMVFRLASLLGFRLLSNFIFFCCMGIAVVLGLLLTVLLCRQDQRNHVMAKKIALLEEALREMRRDGETQNDKT